MAIDPDHVHTRILQGRLFNTLHAFEDARALAQDLIHEHPYLATPHAVLIDALIELGAYEEAIAATDRLMLIRPGMDAYARASYLRELHGDISGATAAMQMAADAGVSGTATRAWALYQLANLHLQQNDLDSAEALLQGILEEYPSYALARGGLGHIALLQRRFDAAETLLKEAYTLEPRDVFAEHLVELFTLTDDLDQAQHYLTIVEEGYRQAYAMGEDVDMEYADYLADTGEAPDEALRLAERNYQRRPDHLHTQETYAWALHQQGRSSEAIPYMARAMRLGTVDPMVAFRAAHIYHRAGQHQAAVALLDQALQENLYVESPSAAQEAEKLLAAWSGLQEALAAEG